MIHSIHTFANARERIRLACYAPIEESALRKRRGDPITLTELAAHVGVLHLKPSTLTLGFPVYDALLMLNHEDGPANNTGEFLRLAQLAGNERKAVEQEFGPAYDETVMEYVEYLFRFELFFRRLAMAPKRIALVDQNEVVRTFEGLIGDALIGYEPCEVSNLLRETSVERR